MMFHTYLKQYLNRQTDRQTDKRRRRKNWESDITLWHCFGKIPNDTDDIPLLDNERRWTLNST